MQLCMLKCTLRRKHSIQTAVIIAKDFEMEHIAFLPRIKKALLRYLQKRQRMQKKAVRRKGVKAVSEAWSHCSKADARGRKKNRSIKLQKLYMDKKYILKKSSK